MSREYYKTQNDRSNTGFIEAIQKSPYHSRHRKAYSNGQQYIKWRFTFCCMVVFRYAHIDYQKVCTICLL